MSGLTALCPEVLLRAVGVSLGKRKMKTLLKPATPKRLKVVGLASPQLLLEPTALPGHNTHAQMVRVPAWLFSGAT